MTNSLKPLLLQPDNFTPKERTPWGGERIVERYKLAHGVSKRLVGESWEISVNPEFPGKLETGERLSEVLARDPEAYLGAEAAAGGTSLLVKLLDARDALSVQIHPADDSPLLGQAESGKPETWYILDAEPGAGIYFGLKHGVTRTALERDLRAGEDVSALLYFVPVHAGDFFRIDPGTPHAVGAGVLLLEPQRVAPGKKGITYRFWDWNRKYDLAGHPDPNGQARQLHLEQALAVTAFLGPREAELLSAAALVDTQPNPSKDPVKKRPLSGGGGLASEDLIVTEWSGTGEIPAPAPGQLWGLTVLSGEACLGGITVKAGRSLVVPAALANLSIGLSRALLVTAWTPP